MAKTATARADGNKKLTDFFGKPNGTNTRQPSTRTRAQAARPAASPLTSDDPTPATQSRPIRQSPRTKVKLESMSAAMPSTSARHAASGMESMSSLTPPEDEQEEVTCRRSPRKRTAAALPGVTPHPTPRSVSGKKSTIASPAKPSLSSVTRARARVAPRTPSRRQASVKVPSSSKPAPLLDLVSVSQPGPKRRRTLASNDVYEIVPGSRSEEQELVVPDSIRNRIRPHHHNVMDLPPSSSPPTSDVELPVDVDMDVLSRASSPLTAPPTDDGGQKQPEDSPMAENDTWNTQASHWEVEHQLDVSHISHTPPASSSPSVTRQNTFASIVASTPPRTQESRMADSPKAIDPKIKTAQRIAEIRARVHTTLADTDEDEPIPLNVLGETPSDESSDEGDPFANIQPQSSKASAQTNGNATFPSDIISVDETPRYSLRDRQKSAPQPTQPSNQMAESSGAAQARSRSKTANPLAHLLREKRAADKRDRGIDGFNEAEQIIRQASSGSSLADNEHEEDDGDGDGYDNDDERVADVPIPTRPPFGATMSLSKLPQERFHTPERVHYLEPGLLQSRDRARLLEGANGAALRTVLDEDLANKRKVVQKRPCGVPFWEETHDVVPSQTFTPENILPPWEVAVEAPTSALSTLINAIEAADHRQVQELIQSGIFNVMPLLDLGTAIPWIASAAISPHTPKGMAVAILHGLDLALSHRAVKARPIADTIVKTIATLHPTASAVAFLSSHLTSDNMHPANTSEDNTLLRRTAVLQIAAIVDLFSRSSSISPDDIPDLVMCLLLTGVDPGTSIEEKLRITAALGALGNRIETPEQEALVANRIVSFAATIDLKNQAYLYSVLCSPVPSPLHRVARWVAHRLLLGEAAGPYSVLPPLSPLEQVLRSRHGSFAIDNHTNFDQYSSRVELVKAALNGLEDYVADEKQEIKLTKALSGKADVKSPLLAIQNALSQLHGAISDNSIDLQERSRTKASLLRLSMCIKYCHDAFLRYGETSGKPRKISEWLRD